MFGLATGHQTIENEDNSLTIVSNDDGEIHDLSFAEASLRVEQKAYVAMANYRPRFYYGKVNFVVAADTKSCFLPPNPAIVWRNFAQEFELDTIPGDHMEMVNMHSEVLASVLTRYIHEATSSGLRADHGQTGKLSIRF